MNIIPAIDLKAGSCVRLFQGCFDQVTAYSADPLAVAKSFEQQGANFLHIVDLDGAKTGQLAHLDLILQILQATNLVIQMGGGIRQVQQLQSLLEAGVSRVIVGSTAVSQPEMIRQWLTQYGPEKLVLGFDVRINPQGMPMLATHGWQINSGSSLWDLLDMYHAESLHILCTDIERDGSLTGPNIALYTECCQRYPNLKFQASGGISQLNDLKKLSAIPVSDVIIGKALYEQRFTLTAALSEVSAC